MEVVFGSIQELYERMKPALFTKKQEMKRNGITYITEDDIWNYLEEKKWKHSRNLSLYEMVSDVLGSDEFAIDQYLKGKMSSRTRRVYFEDER